MKKGGEMTQAFLMGSFNNIGRMKGKAGAAWDTAALNSIGALIDGLARQKYSYCFILIFA